MERLGPAGVSLSATPWNFSPASPVLPGAEPASLARESRPMKRAQLVSIFSRGCSVGRAVLLTGAVLSLLAAPGRSPAQDAGVSGIPLGPGNARGLNGSVNDPSGIGNAARVPAIPPPTITPVTPPTLSAPAVSRTFPVQRAVKIKRTRF